MVEHASLSHHPAPHRDRVSLAQSVFGLLGGPGAWFIQLCTGYALASWPCFPMDERRLLPPPDYGWTLEANVAVSIVAILTALAAAMVSRNIFRRTRDEAKGDHQHLLEVGTGRTRFLAAWGMALGSVFALVSAMTMIAFWVLPRCAG
jgi:hypothetical protein